LITLEKYGFLTSISPKVTGAGNWFRLVRPKKLDLLFLRHRRSRFFIIGSKLLFKESCPYDRQTKLCFKNYVAKNCAPGIFLKSAWETEDHFVWPKRLVTDFVGWMGRRCAEVSKSWYICSVSLFSEFDAEVRQY